MADTCTHSRLQFQSGGFYIGCTDCGVQWVAKKIGGTDTDVDHSRSSAALSAALPAAPLPVGVRERAEPKAAALRAYAAASKDNRCPICRGIESCDHTVLERLRADLTSPPVDSDAVKALDDRERMLLGWMLAAFENSKVGQKITDDLKREMRDANRLIARLSASGVEGRNG